MLESMSPIDQQITTIRPVIVQFSGPTLTATVFFAFEDSGVRLAENHFTQLTLMDFRQERVAHRLESLGE